MMILQGDQCHITVKYRDSAHRYYNIKVKLNHIISIVFHNLRNNDSDLLMKGLANSILKYVFT